MARLQLNASLYVKRESDDQASNWRRQEEMNLQLHF